MGKACRSDAIHVRQLTVDELLVEIGLARARHVSIDTEGWDPLVLEGSSRLLREKLATTISFECTQHPSENTARAPP